VVPLYQQASSENSTNSSGPCDFSIVIYSSQTYSDLTTSNVPVIFAVAVALVFVLVICTFLMYDRFVRRRNEKLVNAAVRSDKILSSLFPSNVKSRLFEAQESTPKATKASSPIGPAFVPAAKSRLRIFLDSGDASDGIQNAASNDDIGYEGKPIADLYVLFHRFGLCFQSRMRLTFPVFVRYKLNQISRNDCHLCRHCRIHRVEFCPRASASLHSAGNSVPGV